MGANIRLDTLGDYERHRANILVQCRACPNRSVLDTTKVRRWFYCHRWNEALEVVGLHLRCRVCRGKPGRIRATLDRPTHPEWMALESDWGRLVKQLRNR